MKELVIWGGTGNFKVLCELLRDDYRIIGFFDNNPDVEPEYRGVPYLGDQATFDQWANERKGDLPFYIVSIGPGKGAVRLQLHEVLKQRGLRPVTAIHRTAFTADTAAIGEGTQVYANATICVEASIGKACIINTRASVDHECVIADGATVGPGAILAGLVEVGANADIYTGAVVLPRVKIGAGAVVGAGTIVRKDVPPDTVVVGNPARIIKVKSK